MTPTTDATEQAHHNDNQRRIGAIETALAANTAVTEELRADTRELLDLFRAAKGGLKVMGWIGTFAKWLAGIAAAFAALYAFIQNLKGH